MPHESARPHDENQAHGHLGWALAVICVAQLMVVLDATVVNVALPSIRTDLGFSATGLEWVVTSYSLAFGGLLLFGGRTGDLFGRRRMFIFGVGLFAVASLLGGFAQNEAWLIIARAAQGMGGAVAAPTALALIATTFPEGAERNRAFGVYAMMAASGAAIGLMLGGILTDVASWRWTLFINVPIGLFVVLAAPRVLGESQGNGDTLDVPGALTATAGMTSLVYGFTNAALHGWGDRTTIISMVVGAVLLVAFVLIELRTTAPLLPMRLLRARNRVGAYLIMLCLAAAMFAVFFFTTQYLQVVKGWSPLKTGFGFVPMALVIMLTSFFVAKRVVGRIGVRVPLLIGPALVTVALILLGRIEPGTSYAYLICSLLVMAVGMGCNFVPLTITAVSGVAHRESGIASALLNTGQQLGGAVGLSVLGTLAAHAGRDRAKELIASGARSVDAVRHEAFTAGQSAALHGAAVAVALAFVASLVLVRSGRGEGSATGAAPGRDGAERGERVEARASADT